MCLTGDDVLKLAPHRRWQRCASAVALAAAAGLTACAAEPLLYASADQRCMAECKEVAANGDSCLVWSASVSASCVSHYSAVEACCGAGDRPLCALAEPLAMGGSCVCHAADLRGATVVQGSACRTN